MSKENLVETLRAFRAGTRQGTVMNRIAKGLDDTDLDALAAYLEQQLH
jgi:cytochrome c553